MDWGILVPKFKTLAFYILLLVRVGSIVKWPWARQCIWDLMLAALLFIQYLLYLSLGQGWGLWWKMTRNCGGNEIFRFRSGVGPMVKNDKDLRWKQNFSFFPCHFSFPPKELFPCHFSCPPKNCFLVIFHHRPHPWPRERYKVSAIWWVLAAA